MTVMIKIVSAQDQSEDRENLRRFVSEILDKNEDISKFVDDDSPKNESE